jgi:hypothetical protein
MLNTIFGSLSAAKGASYSSVVLADNPVGFWLTNETSGSTATDSTANANNLTYIASPTLNVSTGLGGVLAGVTYNGTTQYAKSAKVSTFNMSPNGSWSVEGWFKTTSSTTGTVLMFREDTSTSDGVGGGIFVNLTTNKVSGFTTEATTYASLILTSSTTVNTGSWFYVCLTAASGGALTLYVNGSSEGSTSTTRGSSTNSKIFSTGAQAQAAGAFVTFLNGSSAAVAIYNTTLSADRVAAHYSAGI